MIPVTSEYDSASFLWLSVLIPGSLAAEIENFKNNGDKEIPRFSFSQKDEA